MGHEFSHDGARVFLFGVLFLCVRDAAQAYLVAEGDLEEFNDQKACD